MARQIGRTQKGGLSRSTSVLDVRWMFLASSC